MMKKLVFLYFFLGCMTLQAQIVELKCDFTAGREISMSKANLTLKFIECGDSCNTIKVQNPRDENQSAQVKDDCTVDLSTLLAGTNKKKLQVVINDIKKDLTIKVNTASGIITGRAGDPIEDILPESFLNFKENDCLPELKEGPKSKVIEYNVCCNQFYYSYDYDKPWSKFVSKKFPFLFSSTRDQLVVNDPLIFKLANINYRDYLATVTRAYANYNEEVPEQFEKAFGGGMQFQSGSDSAKRAELEQLKQRLNVWVLDMTSQLTSYYQGLPQCMEVGTFNLWNKQIKDNINQSIITACDSCSTSRDAIAILKFYFAKEINATDGAKPTAASAGSSSASTGSSSNASSSSSDNKKLADKDAKQDPKPEGDDPKPANTTPSKDPEPDPESLKLVGKQIKEFMKLYYGLDKKSYDYQYNIPQVKNYDEIVFTTNIHPKDSTPGIYLKDELISIPIYGGFKIDGSSGLFYSSLTDHVFSTVTDSVSMIAPDGTVSYRSGNRIVRQNSSTGDPGIAGLVHFYSRLGKSLNLAFSMGAGFTFESTPKPRYLLGGSLLIGRNERISLSGGAAFGQVTRLKKEFETPDLYKDVTTITTEKWNKGYFFSLTYNIPFRKKSQQVAPAASSTPSPVTPSSATSDDSPDKENGEDETKEEGKEEDKKEGEEQKEGDGKK
ncbi:MAG: hypothetical protein ABJG78_09530 [Cyclobacteriaceae bacterium]